MMKMPVVFFLKFYWLFSARLAGDNIKMALNKKRTEIPFF